MKQPTAAKLALETGTLACDGVSGDIFLVLAPLGLISTASGWRQRVIQAISDLHQSQDWDRVSVVGISVAKSRSRLEPVVIPRYGSAQYLSTRDMQPRYLARWVIKDWWIVRYVLDMYGVLVGSLQSLDVSFPAIPLSRLA